MFTANSTDFIDQLVHYNLSLCITDCYLTLLSTCTHSPHVHSEHEDYCFHCNALMFCVVMVKAH